jgi:hypothetical protein
MYGSSATGLQVFGVGRFKIANEVTFADEIIFLPLFGEGLGKDAEDGLVGFGAGVVPALEQDGAAMFVA